MGWTGRIGPWNCDHPYKDRQDADSKKHSLILHNTW